MKIVLASLTFAVLVFASSAAKPRMDLKTSERFTDVQVKNHLIHLFGEPAETAIEPTFFETVAVKATKSSTSIEIGDLEVYNTALASEEQYTTMELERLFKQAANREVDNEIFDINDWSIIFPEAASEQ